MKLNKIAMALCVAGITASPLASATNGMLMEGYGPIASGMGGASMAYDNGAAGMANNPATLGLMKDGNRLDLAVGGLGPNVTATCDTTAMCSPATLSEKSGGTAYYMPAGGWVTKSSGLTYGLGLFAVGGMGTEYTSSSWVAGASGQPQRSEVGVGNLILPIAYDVSSDLSVGGSIDYVWASMDLQMAMGGAQMGALASSSNLSVALGNSAYGTPFNNFMASNSNAGYFNFSDNSAFTGAAKGTGYAGKLGVTYKATSSLTVGATYHSKTALSDMTSNANVSFKDNTNAFGMGAGTTFNTTGKVTLVNFQFPETYGVGMSFQANDSLMVAVDYKHIGWKEVMKGFHMKYSTTDMGGIDMDMTMPQNWKDQDVVQLGVAYKATKDLTLRAGANLANNPVPDATVNPLFPATVKDHYTAGVGYDFGGSSINASVVMVPKSTSVAPQNGTVSPQYTITHEQLNWQLMYSMAL